MERSAEQFQQPSNTASLSFFNQVISVWLAIGLLWFLLAIAWAPSTKLYRQGLVLFFWLPTLICLVSQWRFFYGIILRGKAIFIPLLLFFAWATISITWSTDDNASGEIRRVFYVTLFLCGTLYLSCAGKKYRPAQLLTASAYGLAVAALISILIQYGLEEQALSIRLSGIGTIDHPILGGYVMGLMLLWLSANLPEQKLVKVLAFCGIAVMFAFVILTQSRGLWAALLGTAVIYSLLQGGRTQWLLTGALLLFGMVGYWLFSPYVVARGTSFRPEILEASLQMIANNPWLGVGLGADYNIEVGNVIISHSHNIFTHVAIELGLPGLILWVYIWGYCLNTAWFYRHRPEGAALLKALIFCSIALLFDGGSILKTPRPEWFVSWLPITLVIGFQVYTGKQESEERELRSLVSCTKQAIL